MITAGVASAKISELKSKLAIYTEMKNVLRNNYVPADDGEPELVLKRSDRSTVPPEHFESVIEELDEKFAEAEAELAEWEGLTFEPKKLEGGDVRRISDAPPEPQRAPREERKPHGRRFGAAASGKS